MSALILIRLVVFPPTVIDVKLFEYIIIYYGIMGYCVKNQVIEDILLRR